MEYSIFEEAQVFSVVSFGFTSTHPSACKSRLSLLHREKKDSESGIGGLEPNKNTAKKLLFQVYSLFNSSRCNVD
jgi:hypothetical protein